MEGDELTPVPALVHPNMTEAEADLELCRNEVSRLRLQLATVIAERDEYKTQRDALDSTLKRLTRRS